MQPAELQAWLTEFLPAELCATPPHVTIYADEVVIILEPQPAPRSTADDAEVQRSSDLEAIAALRETSRALRMQLAREIEHRLKRPVAWGMRLGASEQLFTSRTIPVMTRLGRAERDVLDTLVAAGVAETRSSALAYAVRAFAYEHAAWLAEIGQTLAEVRRVRARLRLHPRSGSPPGLAPKQPVTKPPETE